jgi:hypothetical protein
MWEDKIALENRREIRENKRREEKRRENKRVQHVLIAPIPPSHPCPQRQ